MFRPASARRAAVVLCLSLIAASASAQAAWVIQTQGVNGILDVQSFDLETAAGTPLYQIEIPSIAGAYYAGLARSSRGEVFAVTSSDARLLRLKSRPFEVSDLGSLDAEWENVLDITSEPDGRRLWLAGDSRDDHAIYRVDTATLGVLRVGTPEVRLSGLAFDGDRLLGVGRRPDGPGGAGDPFFSLFEVDQETAATTLLFGLPSMGEAALGITDVFLTSMDIDENGQIWTLIEGSYLTAPPLSFFYTHRIDPALGAAELVGQNGPTTAVDLEGLVIQPRQVVAVPMLGAWGAALLTLFVAATALWSPALGRRRA